MPLKTIHDNPREIRKQAVRALLKMVPADFGMFFSCVEHDGRWHYTAPYFQGDDELTETFAQHIDTPVFESPWTREHVDPCQINSFIRSHSYFSPEHLYKFETQQKLMRPLEITDELRAVFFDGRKFHGWLGLARRDIDENFTEQEERTVQATIDRFKAALLTADAIEQDLFYSSMLCVVATPDGTLVRASRPARDWLTPMRATQIGRLVRRYDQQKDVSARHVLDGAELHVIRMDGDALRYTVHIGRGAECEIDPVSLLTPRQQQVAEYASVGATNAEIASTLGVSESTVKYHLKRIYRRLDINSRVDLSRP